VEVYYLPTKSKSIRLILLAIRIFLIIIFEPDLLLAYILLQCLQLPLRTFPQTDARTYRPL
jgi:hypothetical protein